MKFIRSKQLKRLAFVKLTLLLLVSFTQQAFTAAIPQPNAFYAAIWAVEAGTPPIKTAALNCYTNVISLPGRIENTTKHVLKHMTFPKAAGQTVPRQLLCWVIPEGPNGRQNAKVALMILSDLYKTGPTIGNIRHLATTPSISEADIQKLRSGIDAIVAYADTIKNKFGFPVDYEYSAHVQPEWIIPSASLSPYEQVLRDNEAVRQFIGTWHSGRPDRYSNIIYKLNIQSAYFTAIEQTMPEIMTCFQYCVKKICGSVFTAVEDITKIVPSTRPIDLIPPSPTTLYRRFNARVIGANPVDGQYAVFAKTVSDAEAIDMPAHTISINDEVQAMASNTQLAHIRVGIGHELREEPHPQHYETDIRTMFIASGYPQ